MITPKQLGELLRQCRELNSMTREEAAGLVSTFNIKGFTPERLELIECGQAEGVSLFEITTLCKVFKMDFGSLVTGTIRPEYTALEILDELDPGGVGTVEQRAIRLYLHEEISRGRACEILGINQMNLPIHLDSTGCSCSTCQDYLEWCRKQNRGIK